MIHKLLVLRLFIEMTGTRTVNATSQLHEKFLFCIDLFKSMPSGVYSYETRNRASYAVLIALGVLGNEAGALVDDRQNFVDASYKSEIILYSKPAQISI